MSSLLSHWFSMSLLCPPGLDRPGSVGGRKFRREEPYKAVGRRVNHCRGRHLSVSPSCPGIVWKAEEPNLANDKVGSFVLPAGPPTLLRGHASVTAKHKPPLHTHSAPCHACLSLLWDQVSAVDPKGGESMEEDRVARTKKTCHPSVLRHRSACVPEACVIGDRAVLSQHSSLETDSLTPSKSDLV